MMERTVMEGRDLEKTIIRRKLEKVEKNRVLYRVSPEHKVKIVKNFKIEGTYCCNDRRWCK